MSKTLTLFIALLLLTSCEQEFQVYTDAFESQPVIYCFIDPLDTTHYIRIQKTFSAEQNPSQSAGVLDSIYINQAQVLVKLKTPVGERVELLAQKVEDYPKMEGLFAGDGHHVFAFKQIMSNRGYSFFKEIAIEVRIPGMPVAKGRSEIMPRAVVRWPYVAQQYLFMDQERPILVQWYGDAWNEVDISFSVMEQYRDSTTEHILTFEEKTEIILLEDIVEVKFPYDLVVENLARKLDKRRKPIRRYFGPVRIKVHAGNRDFARYIETKDGINDFNGAAISNIENAWGFIGCKWSTEIRPLQFDYFTRQRLAEDPRLAPFGFKEY